jgi:hypothetical protein
MSSSQRFAEAALSLYTAVSFSPLHGFTEEQISCFVNVDLVNVWGCGSQVGRRRPTRDHRRRPLHRRGARKA